jgi:hypothetical protein
MSYDVPFDEDELSIAYVEIIDALSDEEAEAIVMRVAGGDPSCAAEARCILKLAAREGDLLHPDNARDVRIALLEHAVPIGARRRARRAARGLRFSMR